MKALTKEAWSKVHLAALDVTNAMLRNDSLMADVYRSHLLGVLDELEAEFGKHSQILATKADFLMNPSERKVLYKQALDLAETKGDEHEIEEILDSLRQWGEDE